MIHFVDVRQHASYKRRVTIGGRSPRAPAGRIQTTFRVLLGLSLSADGPTSSDIRYIDIYTTDHPIAQSTERSCSPRSSKIAPLDTVVTYAQEL